MNAAQRNVAVRHRFALHGQLPQTQQITAILPPPPEPLCRPEELAAAHKLVVRRDAGLGDCLMILPTLGAIRQHFPHLKIIFQAPAAYTKLLAGFGEVDKAVALDELTELGAGSDVVHADLSNYMERHPQAWLVPRIDLAGTAFGIAPVPHTASYQPPPEIQREAQAWLKEHECRKRARVGIALRGIYGHRSWLVPYVFELARRLAAQNWEVLIFDADPHAQQCPGTDDFDGPGAVACAYGLELPVVAALLASCDAAIVPDTGLLHLAACTGTPFVAIFGAVPPELRLNYYQNYRCLTVQGRVPCVPCCEGPQHIRCRYECLWAITPEEVELALHELLTKTSAEHRQIQITG